MNPVTERTTPATIELKSPKTNGEPKTVRWTRDKYYRMAELGFFTGKRVELIGGEIIEMAPMKTAHATARSLAIEVLQEVFSDGFVIRTQLPMSFGKSDEPEPDVAVVEGSVRDFSESHPKNAALIIEVSDTTLSYDRTRKASLYAQNNIQDYWILNLKNRCLEVYRRPIKDRKLGHVYTEINIITENDSIAPLIKPAAKINIIDILP